MSIDRLNGLSVGLLVAAIVIVIGGVMLFGATSKRVMTANSDKPSIHFPGPLR